MKISFIPPFESHKIKISTFRHSCGIFYYACIQFWLGKKLTWRKSCNKVIRYSHYRSYENPFSLSWRGHSCESSHLPIITSNYWVLLSSIIIRPVLLGFQNMLVSNFMLTNFIIFVLLNFDLLNLAVKESCFKWWANMKLLWFM